MSMLLKKSIIFIILAAFSSPCWADPTAVESAHEHPPLTEDDVMVQAMGQRPVIPRALGDLPIALFLTPAAQRGSNQSAPARIDITPSGILRIHLGAFSEKPTILHEFLLFLFNNPELLHFFSPWEETGFTHAHWLFRGMEEQFIKISAAYDDWSFAHYTHGISEAAQELRPLLTRMVTYDADSNMLELRFPRRFSDHKDLEFTARFWVNILILIYNRHPSVMTDVIFHESSFDLFEVCGNIVSGKGVYRTLSLLGHMDRLKKSIMDNPSLRESFLMNKVLYALMQGPLPGLISNRPVPGNVNTGMFYETMMHLIEKGYVRQNDVDALLKMAGRYSADLEKYAYVRSPLFTAIANRDIHALYIFARHTHEDVRRLAAEAIVQSIGTDSAKHVILLLLRQHDVNSDIWITVYGGLKNHVNNNDLMYWLRSHLLISNSISVNEGVAILRLIHEGGRRHELSHANLDRVIPRLFDSVDRYNIPQKAALFAALYPFVRKISKYRSHAIVLRNYLSRGTPFVRQVALEALAADYKEDPVVRARVASRLEREMDPDVFRVAFAVSGDIDAVIARFQHPETLTDIRGVCVDVLAPFALTQERVREHVLLPALRQESTFEKAFVAVLMPYFDDRGLRQRNQSLIAYTQDAALRGELFSSLEAYTRRGNSISTETLQVMIRLSRHKSQWRDYIYQHLISAEHVVSSSEVWVSVLTRSAEDGAVVSSMVSSMVSRMRNISADQTRRYSLDAIRLATAYVNRHADLSALGRMIDDFDSAFVAVRELMTLREWELSRLFVSLETLGRGVGVEASFDMENFELHRRLLNLLFAAHWDMRQGSYSGFLGHIVECESQE